MLVFLILERQFLIIRMFNIRQHHKVTSNKYNGFAFPREPHCTYTGKKYTGGKTYFKDYPDLIISIPDNEVFIIKITH